MKLFPLILAASFIAPAGAMASGDNNGNGCRNRCGDTIINEGSRDYNDGRTYNEGGSANQGQAQGQGQGQAQGQGQSQTANGGNGYGGRGGDARQGQGQGQSQSSNSSSNSSASTESSSNQSQSANNSGNNQNIRFEGDERAVPVAPIPVTDSVGRVGDISVPLPNVGLGAFTSTQSNGELDYGVSVGVRVPLGAGSFREAADREFERREQRALFTLVSEAIALRDAGVLDPELHPDHWAAINK